MRQSVGELPNRTREYHIDKFKLEGNTSVLGGSRYSKRWTFSETMDIRDFTVCIIRCSLCVSRRIDTWHIVYLSNKDPCPKILAHKSEIKVGTLMSHRQHGQRWKFTSFSIQKVARPRGTNLQLAVNSRKFHRCPCCPWDINVP